MVPLYILMVACLNVKGQRVLIEKKVSAFGETLTLLCKLETPCKRSVGWGVRDPNWTTLFVDVRHVNISATAKYGSEARPDGYTLSIRNLSRNDLNKNYTCNCKFKQSENLFLNESSAFTHVHDSSDNLVSVVLITIAILSLVAITLLLGIPPVITVMKNRTRMLTDYSAPTAIQKMGNEKIEKYRNLLKDGKERRYYVKIFFLGKYGVGKTSLMRRLLNRDITDVKSTHGLDIVKECKISVPDGDWIFNEDKSERHAQVFARCIMVDFAGEKEYYITHQTFLTVNAVCLIANSLQEENVFSDNVPNEEKVSFWLDNIHLYATKRRHLYIEQAELKNSDNQADKEPKVRSTKKEHELDPPIIAVCTHASLEDLKEQTTGRNNEMIPTEYHSEDFAKRKIRFTNLFFDILKVNDRKKHVCGDIQYLSNKSKTDETFDELRTRIYHAATTLPDWGKELPKNWIELEDKLDVERREKKIVQFGDVKSMAENTSPKFENDDEIVFFLNYQHLTGNIIFFEDIKEAVILQPHWLNDAFKCLVCAKKFRSLKDVEIWRNIETNGEVKEQDIKQLMSTIPEVFHHKHVIIVMEKFDIIVKDRINDNEEIIYIIPSMIKKKKPDSDEYNRRFAEGKKSSWLCMKFGFLPPVVFNYMVVRFLRDSRFERDDLWHGMCVFSRKDTNKTQKLIFCEFSNTITFQFVLYDENDSFSSRHVSENAEIVLEHLNYVISNYIEKKHGMKVQIKKHLMCNFHFDSLTQFSDKPSVDIIGLKRRSKFTCSHDRVNTTHNAVDDEYSFWTKSVEKSEVFDYGKKVIQDAESSIKRFKGHLEENDCIKIKKYIAKLEVALQIEVQQTEPSDIYSNITKVTKKLEAASNPRFMKAYRKKMTAMVTNARHAIRKIESKLISLDIKDKIDDINPSLKQQIEKINHMIKHKFEVAPETIEYATADLEEMTKLLFKEESTGAEAEIEEHTGLLSNSTTQTHI